MPTENPFEDLRKSLQEVLAKSRHSEPDGDEPEEEDEPEDNEELNDDEPVAKSLTAIVNGEEVEAYDAGPLLKSLTAEVDDLKIRSDGRLAAIESQISGVGALLADAVPLLKSLAADNEAKDGRIGKLEADLAKALGELETIGGQGRGRKSALTVHEKPEAGVVQKSQGEAPTKADVLAKASAAYDARKITGREFNTLDVCLRHDFPLDDSILRKIL